MSRTDKTSIRDYHRWIQSDIFPAKIKQTNFGDNFNLLMAFLYDWRGQDESTEEVPNTAEELIRTILKADPVVEKPKDEERALSILKTWVSQTQAYFVYGKNDFDTPFKTLTPVHLDFARLWPSIWASESSNVGLHKLYFSLLGFNDKGKVDTKILESVRDFFSIRDPKKIGAFARIVLDTFPLPVLDEKSLESERETNLKELENEIVAPFCKYHASVFRNDLQNIMKFKKIMAHVELIDWLYTCICFHLATYVIRTAKALRGMLEEMFTQLKGAPDSKSVVFGCEQCKGLEDCPYSPDISVSTSHDFHDIDEHDPCISKVIEHRKIVIEHGVYLPVLSLMRDVTSSIYPNESMILPSGYYKLYTSNSMFKRKVDKILPALVKRYVELAGREIEDITSERLGKTLDSHPQRALEVFRDAVLTFYQRVGSQRDSRQQLWGFNRALSSSEGADFMTAKSGKDPPYYTLSLKLLSVMAHILLVDKNPARLVDFIQFLHDRGIIIEQARYFDQFERLSTNLQQLGMYVKTSDDISAQFLYPLYDVTREDAE